MIESHSAIAEQFRKAIEKYCLEHTCRRLKVSTALIDMDGVLYDSMPAHSVSWHRLATEIGIDATPEEFYLYEGMTGTGILNKMHKRQFGTELSMEEATRLYAIKAKYFQEINKGVKMPGAEDMLNRLGESGVVCVLVTGSAQKSLLDKLSHDYPGAFADNRRVTALDVTHGKPNPEPYLQGQAKAGAPANECIVIENAPLGVVAGHASGAFTIAVATGPIPHDTLWQSGADLVFNSMPEFAEQLPILLQVARETTISLDQEIIFTNEVDAALKSATESYSSGRYIITDNNVDTAAVSQLDVDALGITHKIVIPAGEENKNINTVAQVWNQLSTHRATRQSIAINIGGGVVTDLAGFAAGTFKRGINFVNVPTTLLSAVDAAVGGKTGVDFNGLKNEVGMFRNASTVIISTRFFTTLPDIQIKSGFGEMLKHAFLDSTESVNNLLAVDLNKNINTPEFLQLLKESVMIKYRIVQSDPTEKGLRKALNLGHTVGHAFESLALQRQAPVPHGYAVAWGLVVELILSHLTEGLDSALMQRTAQYIRDLYGAFRIDCDDYPQIIELMRHDKKSSHGELNFSLLKSPGATVLNCAIPQKEVEAALDIYRDLMGI